MRGAHPEPAAEVNGVNKKEALTLSQLASYDDLCTDALVDRVYFWTTIRKNRSRYFPCRGLHEEEIAGILRQNVVIEKDAAKAATLILGLSGIKKYHDRLPSDSAREHFARHVRKYVDIYLPDCPWECATTNRYTIDTHEAATFARRSIKKGELIKYLSGIQAPITKEEEKDLDLTRRDFSIVMSSRKKLPMLFLGPARFANHDCDANSRLTTRGSNGMTVVAVKDIKRGEEITVTYGHDYFGIDNCECLCATCERLQRNGWDPYKKAGSSSGEDEEGEDEEQSQSPRSDSALSLRKGHVLPTDSGLSSREITPEVQSTTGKKRKFDEVSSGLESMESTPKHPRLQGLKNRPMSKLRQSFCADSNDASAEVSEVDTGRSSSPLSASADVITNSQSQSHFPSSAPTSIADSACLVEDQTQTAEVVLNKDTILEMPVEALQKLTEQADLSMTVPVDVVEQSEPKASIEIEVDIPDVHATGNSSDLSDLDETMVIDDKRHAIIRRKDFGQPRVTRRALAQLTKKEGKAVLALNLDLTRSRSADRSSADPNARRPGDYTLTPRLLVTPYSRWVKCRVCSNNFVQSDAYQTRFACPRCERHSKLYGYQWPKTDKAGKHDTEERILDHRTVHRFVDTEEEKIIRKGRRSGLHRLIAEAIEETEMESDDDDDSDIEETTPKKRGRKLQRFEEEEEVETPAALPDVPAVPLKRGRGRPRKHPLPEDITSGVAAPPAVVKEEEKVKPPEPTGPQAEVWHDKHGRFGGRWLYLTEMPKALYDDDRSPSPTPGKRRAAQAAAAKLPDSSGYNRRKSMPVQVEEPVVEKPNVAKGKKRKSVATAAAPLRPAPVPQRRQTLTQRKRASLAESIRVARHVPIKVESPEAKSSSEDEIEEPTSQTRKYVRSGLYTKEAMSARKAQARAEGKTVLQMLKQEQEEAEEEARSRDKPGKLKKPSRRVTIG